MRRDLGTQVRVARSLPVRIERAILFGSRIGGNHLRDRDLDLILVSKDFEGVPFTDRPKAVHRYWTSRVDLHLLCLTPKEFAKKSRQITIIREALREGISLSEKDLGYIELSYPGAKQPPSLRSDGEQLS